MACFLLLADVTSFKNLLTSIKAGRPLEDRGACQFDVRTEESSAVQYFQVSRVNFAFSISYSLPLVLWLSFSTTEHDARLYSHLCLSTSDSLEFHGFRWQSECTGSSLD